MYEVVPVAVELVLGLPRDRSAGPLRVLVVGIDVVDVDVDVPRPSSELVGILVVAFRRAEHDHSVADADLGVVDAAVVAGQAHLLGGAERAHEKLERSVRILVQQIRHHTRIALWWVLRHSSPPFLLARSTASQRRPKGSTYKRA